MAKRYYYKVVQKVKLPWIGPDQRRERWKQRGRQFIQPMETLHSVTLNPSKGYTLDGQEIPPDYVVTDRPVAKHLTSEVTKKVSRPGYEIGSFNREDREKTSKVKLVLLGAQELTDYARRMAHDLNWGPAMFDEASDDVHLPADEARFAAAGAKSLRGVAAKA